MGQGREAEVALVIDELQEAFPGSSVALLTRTGSLYAGRVPPDVNRETFAAMMAVMHGASETGTAELGEELVTAELRLTNGAVFVVGAGKKMLLCAHFKDGAALDGSRAKLSSAAARLGALF
jgi:predicted regulator of Ras-like GTPase activity (Roadblock/LC7/MglB family)